MFDFIDEIIPKRLRVLDPDIDYIRRRHSEINQNVKDYWRQSAVMVKSDHVLAKILSMVVRNGDRVYSQYFSTEKQAYSIASTLGMVTNRTVGRVRSKGDFYGIREIYYFKPVEDSLKLLRNLEGWKEWTPIRVSKHPYSSLNYKLPNGNYEHHEDIAIIEIDIPLLYAQYQQWRGHQVYFFEDPVLHPSSFIVQYPLANMLESHTDVAFFNRFIHFIDGIKEEDEDYEAFLSGNPTPYTFVDEVIETYIRKLSRTTIRFKDLVNMITLIHQDSAGYLYYKGDIPDTRSNSLTEVIKVLPLYYLLFKLSSLSGSESLNLKWENDFARIIHVMKSGNYFNTIANLDSSTILKEIDERIVPLFRRQQ